MSGYFGTEAQQKLQAQAEAAADFIRNTPGACQAARIMGCDRPEALGWDRIDRFLRRDGACGFRLIPIAEVQALRTSLAARNFRFDAWDVFVGDRATALPASEAIIARGLPGDLTVLDPPRESEGEDTLRIQALMAASGIVPFSGSFLVGALGPALTVALGDRTGSVVAASHGYFPHNRFSAYQSYAWGGLVAVADSHRGKGLGAHINARMIVGMFHDLGATHIHELVSSSNVPSRRMVEACGLRHEPGLVCGIATPADSERFTR